MANTPEQIHHVWREWHDGSLLMWEYPSQTPAGRQAGLVESMDLENGLITHHRVYWGWVGVRALLEKKA